jgi:hypothetical protein
MGNLIIKKVKYYGDKYSFESPEFTTGINIIVGDNGSGKSTLAYFIEFGLGGDVNYFKNNKENRYDKIVKDINNYVKLDIIINNRTYSLKRFIGKNDVFVEDGEDVKKFPIIRNSDYAPYIFSDWMLNKLEITVFSLTLGTIDWLINFKDLFRLLDYDQDTEARKIFKSPPVESFITDSVVVRKAVFETLVGISSEDYNIKFNEYKKAQNLRNESRALLDNFINLYAWVENENLIDRKSKLKEAEDQLEKLLNERSNYQKEATNSSDKTNHLTEIQTEMIDLEIKISDDSLRANNYDIERSKTYKLLEQQKDEISQIEKIIFTHDKLNLFSLEICPFCMSDITTAEGRCICGSKIKDEDYEKFVYKSSEYKDILDHKKKSIQAIERAFNSYDSEIFELERTLTINKIISEKRKDELKEIIASIAFSGNSQLIDRINDKILEVRQKIVNEENTIKLIAEHNRLDGAFEGKNDDLKSKKLAFEEVHLKFEENNKETIKDFNAIYSTLLSKSSLKSEKAEINEDYMPYIDGGTYREKSAIVPIRLMYYFTLLTLALKRDNVKHPRFLLIDTPEEAGIDDSNLKLNLALLKDGLELSKNDTDEAIKDFQVILTTGEDKYPKIFEEFIKMRFNKTKGEFILKTN